MPKFVFPMSFESFRNAVKDVKAFAVLQNSEDDALEFAFSCLRMGWMNKQYHKEKQQRDQAMARFIKEKMMNDPELRKRLEGHDERKGTTGRRTS